MGHTHEQINPEWEKLGSQADLKISYANMIKQDPFKVMGQAYQAEQAMRQALVKENEQLKHQLALCRETGKNQQHKLDNALKKISNLKTRLGESEP